MSMILLDLNGAAVGRMACVLDLGIYSSTSNRLTGRSLVSRKSLSISSAATLLINLKSVSSALMTK